MKKILVFLLATTMILSMVAICSSANDLNEPVEYRDENGDVIPFTKADGTTVSLQEGKVPKIVGYDVVVDGQKEDFYDDGLRVNISRLAGNLDKPVSGTAYFVYDDNNIYLFVECNDDDFFNINDYVNICPDCGKQRGKDSGCAHMAEGEHDPCNLWDDDCIEFMIDWSNDGSVPTQYRISRSGYMSRDYDTFNTGFSGKGYNAGATWGAEFSVPLDTSAIGTELGIHVMIHSQNSIDPYNETYAMDNNYNVAGTPWQPDYFDYVVLSDPMPDFTPPTPGPSDEKPTVPGGDPAPTVPGGQPAPTVPGGQPAPTVPGGQPAPTVPGGQPAPTTPQGTNPVTADPIVYIILVAVVSLGAAVVVKKTCFNK